MFYNHLYIISDHAILDVGTQLWSKHPLSFMELDVDT